jgi:hypothetical protein
MRILQIVVALLMLIGSPAMASDSSAWIVTQKSGDVRVLRNGVQSASVQLRAALAPGDVVATGANGRAMLTKGEDYVVVAPASRLVLPRDQQQAGFTRLIQQVGTMLYKVKRTGVPHFAVDTPMLAAVVKGTTFTVVVDDNRAAVQVTEGVVEVSSIAGDARRLVEGGMTVYIGRERPNEIIELKSSTRLPGANPGAGEAVKIESSKDVPLTAVANLTDGLVHATAAPIVGATDANSIATAPGATSALPTTPAVGNVVQQLPGITGPVVDAAEPILPGVTDPIVDVVDTVVPGVTKPVVDVIDAVLPDVTDPVVDVVETVIPEVTEPVVDIIETVVPDVTEPVVEIVETVVPDVTEPVVEIVETVVPEVTEPVVDIVETVVPDVICTLLCPR